VSADARSTNRIRARLGQFSKKVLSTQTSALVDSSPSGRSAKPISRSGFSIPAGVLGVVLCCLPFYVSILPPLDDFSQHVLVARIISNYSDPVLRFSDYFTIEWQVAPTSLFYLLLVGLQKVVGPFWDARIYLTLWVAASWLSVAYLAKVRGHVDPWLTALVVLPLAFSWYVYGGTLPYLTTLPLFALAAAVWFSDRQPTAKIALLWVLMFMLFGFHIVGAAAAAAAVVAGAIARVSMEGGDRRQLMWASIAVTPVPVLTGVYLLGQHGPRAKIGYTGLVNQVVDVVKFTCATLDDVATGIMLLWLGLLGLVLVFRWRDLTSARPIFASAAFLIGLAIVMPGTLGSLWPAGPRLLPFAIVLLIASVRWTELGRASVVVSCTALLAALSLATARHAMELDRGFQDFLSGAAIIQPGKSVLPILVNRYEGSRWTVPYWSLGSAYTVMRGGSNPYVFADPYVKTGASPLRYRRAIDDRRFAFLYAPTRGPADYRGVATSYDYVLLWGISPAIAAVLEGEMTRIHGRGDAALFARRELSQDQRGLGSTPHASRGLGTPMTDVIGESGGRTAKQ
jgi:hypothetical protein